LRPGGPSVWVRAVPTLRLTGLRPQFGSVVFLDGADLVVEAGTLCCLLGPSVSGKTTLLKLLAGQRESQGGTMLLDNRDITFTPAGARGFGLVRRSCSSTSRRATSTPPRGSRRAKSSGGSWARRAPRSSACCTIVVCIRPEGLRLDLMAPDENVFAGAITASLFQGDVFLHDFRTPSGAVLPIAEANLRQRVGSKAKLFAWAEPEDVGLSR